MTPQKTADTAVPVHPLLAERWSPRGFATTHRLDDARLTALLEAARWAPHASALVLVATQTTDETGRPRPWALYDTGQAVSALSVQAEALGLHVHQMGGFDADAARHDLELAEDLTPVVVVAIGELDPNAALPEPLAAREQAPRTRESLQSLLLTAPGSGRRAA